MTEDNKTFSFYLSKGTICCIVCNMLVNHVCFHALFLYVICVMSVLNAFQSLCCMLPNLNKTSELSCTNVNKVNSEFRFLPLLWRFNLTEPVVEISVIL